MSKGILYDATLCVNCKECEKACAQSNKLAYDDTIAAEQKTSEHKFTYVAMTKKGEDEKYMRRMCMHCQDPACASACPVGALQKTKLGAVTYDASKCMGCRYCMVACPYSMPKYEWSKAIPTIKKCILCSDRVAAGKQTACAEACPAGSTIFGDRETLIAEAHKRINENPSQYLKHVFGEKDIGGSSVLLISSVPFGDFGLPTQYGSEALPPLTGRVLAHIPDVAVYGFTLLGGIWWITNRREAVSAVEKMHDEHK